MKLKNTTILLLMLCLAPATIAQKYTNTETSVVKRSYNGVEFSSNKSLFENLSEAPGFTVYREMLESHGESLLSEGFMGTVFVLPDSSFNLDTDDPEAPNLSDSSLQKRILEYLIVPGRIDAHALKKAATRAGGTARLSTLSGESLAVRLNGEELLLMDSKGNTSRLIATDLYHKHGFFHIADALVLPEQ